MSKELNPQAEGKQDLFPNLTKTTEHIVDLSSKGNRSKKKLILSEFKTQLSLDGMATILNNLIFPSKR